MVWHIDRDHTFVYENNFYSDPFSCRVNELAADGIPFPAGNHRIAE
jgi:hypothetical protein